MNKKLINLVFVGVVSVFVINFIVTKKVSAVTMIDTTTATGIGATIDSAPAVNPTNVRERIRADIGAKMNNTKVNQEARNEMLENRYKMASGTTRMPLPPKILNRASSTPPRPAMDCFRDGKSSTTDCARPPMSSSTIPFFRKEMRKDREGYENEGRSMLQNVLKDRKEKLGGQLEIALKNLKDLRDRIASRIEKDRLANKDLTNVKNLLKIADEKLALAKQAVEAVKSYTPSNKETTTSTVSSTTKAVNLEQIRSLVEKAQLAIKDAHKALVDVVVAIAKISGLPKGNATSTPPTPSTTTSPTSTTTTTTTTN